MEPIHSLLQIFFDTLFLPLAGHSIFGSLILISTLAAMLVVLVVESLSNKSARTQALRQLWAHLLAIRLFADDPYLVLQGLGGIIVANTRMLISAIPPLAVLVPLSLLLYGYLNAFFGSPPLLVGVPRVLTVRLNHLDNGWPDIRLETPAWITVDSPPIHILDEKEISWSIHTTQAARGVVKIITANEVIEKTIDSRPGPRYFSPARMQSLSGALQYPAENQLPSGLISEVNLIDPAPVIFCCGFALEWGWWFVIFSALLAFPVKWGYSRLARQSL